MREISAREQQFIDALMAEEGRDEDVQASTDDVVLKQAMDELRGVSDGTIRRLPTGLKLFDAEMQGGFRWRTLFVLAGRSGSGKTTIMNMFQKGFLKLSDDFIIVNHNMEIPKVDLKIKSLTEKNHLSMSTVLSDAKAAKELLTQLEYEEQHKKDENIDPRVLYIDRPMRARDLERKLYQLGVLYNVRFSLKLNDAGQLVDNVPEVIRDDKGKPILGADGKALETKLSERGLIYIHDHTTLNRESFPGQSEERMLNDVMNVMIRVRNRMKCILILGNQLNRNIESEDRLNPQGRKPDAFISQFPRSSDLRGADSVFFAADIVMVSHMPSMLNLTVFGPKMYPVKQMTQSDGERNLIYWFFLKGRYQKATDIRLAEFFHKGFVAEVDPGSGKIYMPADPKTTNNKPKKDGTHTKGATSTAGREPEPVALVRPPESGEVNNGVNPRPNRFRTDH
jgi:hypothetical protein